MNDNLDILVCGAGPAGLATALAFARMGTSVRIIDKHADITPLNGAVTFNSRSLELLDAIDVADRCIERGHIIESVNLRDQNFDVTATLDYANLKHKYPFVLSLPQCEFESILVDALQELGVTVERLKHYESMAQGELMLTAVIKSDDGVEEHVQSKLLVAADGEHSKIRQESRISFGITEFERVWSIADIETEFDYGDANFCMLKDAMMYLQRIKDNTYRIVANTRNAHTLLPQPLRQEELLWQVENRVTCHQVRSYQFGRMFFVGQAAHSHLPFYGRNLYMGLEDAITLAAMAAQNTLDDYHDNRYKANLRLLNESERLLRLAEKDEGWFVTARNLIVKGLLRRKRLQAKFLADISGL